MSVTPTGPLSLPIAGVRDLLAASATWQTVCDVETAAAALERIHIDEYDPETENGFPHAVVLDHDSFTHTKRRITLGQGQLAIVFMLIPEGDNDVDKRMNFRNTVGAILTEMLALANTPNPDTSMPYWAMTTWQKQMAPQIVTDSAARFGEIELITSAYLIEWTE